MKRKKVILLPTLALLAVVLLTACGNQENPVGDSTRNVVYMLPKAKPMSLTKEQKDLVKKNNDFSVNLFRTINELDKEKKSNFLSPISVTYLLSMLNDGAAGETSKEIKQRTNGV